MTSSTAIKAVLSLLIGVSAWSCTRISGLDGKKKVIRQNRIDKGKTMDPQVQFDEPSSVVIGMLFDGLYEYHYLKRPYQLVPSIASEMPRYSADRLTLTIPLRTDVKFIDDKCFAGGKGRTVVASDIVYSLKRYADASINDSSYGIIDGMIVGLNEFRDKTKGKEFGSVKYDDFNVEGLQAIDEHTVQIKLTKPNSVVEYALGAPVTSIIPRECTELYKQDFGTYPVGTGPFKIKYRNRLGDLVVERNPNYHMVYPTEGMPGDAEKGLLKNAGKKLPLVDEIYSPVIMEFQPAMLRFLRGYFDWVVMDSDSFLRMAFSDGPGSFKLKPEYEKNFDIYSEPDVGTYWIVTNLKDSLLGTNVKLRKAMALAINRQGFIDDMLNGRGVVIDSVVPVTIAGNHLDSNVKFPNYNVEEAKKALAEAGFPEGKGLPVIKYTGATGGNTMRQFEYLRRNWAEIGIKVEPDFTTYSAYLKRMDEGNFQIAFTGWHADYPDAENFLYWLSGPSKAEGENYGNYQSKAYDELYKKIAGHPDSPERRELIRQMGVEVAKDYPIIPVYAPYRVGVTSKWLSGFKRSLMSDRQLQYLDVDAAAQKKGL